MATATASATRFSARPRSAFTDKDARRIGPRLVRIRERSDGKLLKPETVVEDARDPSSPLHRYFTWDDTEAAALWRLEQARGMIRAIFIIPQSMKKPEPVRFFHNVNTEQGRGYVAIEDVKADEHMREQVVAYALVQLQGWTQRYKDYAELFPVIEAINRALEGITNGRDAERNGRAEKRAPNRQR